MQMYRLIWIHPDDRRFQNILWRNNSSETLECLQSKTVTFGMAAAPLLATRCLVELANQIEFSYPIEANIIK